MEVKDAYDTQYDIPGHRGLGTYLFAGSDEEAHEFIRLRGLGETLKMLPTFYYFGTAIAGKEDPPEPAFRPSKSSFKYIRTYTPRASLRIQEAIINPDFDGRYALSLMHSLTFLSFLAGASKVVDPVFGVLGDNGILHDSLHLLQYHKAFGPGPLQESVFGPVVYEGPDVVLKQIIAIEEAVPGYLAPQERGLKVGAGLCFTKPQSVSVPTRISE